MYENLTRLDLVGPALARALGDPGWQRLEASLVSVERIAADGLALLTEGSRPDRP
jgi:limonene-1,2-epoxide hydrolase